MILMSIYEVYGRAEIEVDGVIIKSEIVCQQPNNNRCVTNYLVKQILGERQTIFSAGPTDLSLPRDLPIGTALKKEKWKLNYELNGKTINDFPVYSYVGMFVIGIISFAIWFMQRDHRPEM